MTDKELTDEELKYYKALQRVFRKMGPYRHSDRVIVDCGNLKLSGIVIDDLVIGQQRIVYIDGTSANIKSSELKGRIIRLPLPIDPVNPKRGLWGMIDWIHTSISTIGLRGEVQIIISNPISPVSRKIIIGPLTLALLMALASQEGVKIDE